jgi:putative endonuclease
MTHHLAVGQAGEDLAAAFLERLGYRVLDRNYRFERAELDIVCFAPDFAEVVFVEVKTRSDTRFAPPEAAVTPEKQANLFRVAEAYLYERKLQTMPARFDVIAISLANPQDPDILHLKDAIRF